MSKSQRNCFNWLGRDSQHIFPIYISSGEIGVVHLLDGGSDERNVIGMPEFVRKLDLFRDQQLAILMYRIKNTVVLLLELVLCAALSCIVWCNASHRVHGVIPAITPQLDAPL